MGGVRPCTTMICWVCLLCDMPSIPNDVWYMVKGKFLFNYNSNGINILKLTYNINGHVNESLYLSELKRMMGRRSMWLFEFCTTFAMLVCLFFDALLFSFITWQTWLHLLDCLVCIWWQFLDKYAMANNHLYANSSVLFYQIKLQNVVRGWEAHVTSIFPSWTVISNCFCKSLVVLKIH